jgi:hypothetical protein
MDPSCVAVGLVAADQWLGEYRWAAGCEAAAEHKPDLIVTDVSMSLLNGVEATRQITADHIVAISKGGSNTIENIQPLRYSCTSEKGDELVSPEPLPVRGCLGIEGLRCVDETTRFCSAPLTMQQCGTWHL